MYPKLPPTPPPAQPSAPPSDEGYGESGSDDPGSRGVVRPHSDSPFVRNVRTRRIVEEEEEIDVEDISLLLNFSTRGISANRTPPAPPSLEGEMVRPIRTSTPRTPAAAVGPERPPRISSSRIFPLDTPHPRPLRRPPSAALGDPPQQEGEEDMQEESVDLPDISDTPQSPTVSDITVLRLVLLFIFGGIIYIVFFVFF